VDFTVDLWMQMRNGENVLVLSGPSGVGKTVLFEMSLSMLCTACYMTSVTVLWF
jgi:guanylate kinase